MTERPFDARQALLSDHDGPAGEWRTVSLVTAMREFISRDPDGVIPNAASHCATLSLCAEELTARGLDANSLVRYGLAPRVVASVLGPYLARLVDPTATFDGPQTLAESRASDWRNLLNDVARGQGLDPDAIESTPAGLVAPLAAILPSVLVWCQNASLADLISLKAPELEWLGRQRLLESDNAVLHQYQWMVDRFSITNLGDWAEDSLHLEYRWSNDRGAAPCAPTIMLDRAVPRADLDREIARRTMSPSDPEIPQISASLASRMQDPACALLRDRKFEAAATLFEFAASENPRDSYAQNNLGFCLMPSDLDRAWAHLNQAAQLNYEPAIINIFNRIQCLALLGDKVGALALADEEWAAAALTPRMPATLWRLDSTSGTLQLTERVDPVDALVTLAIDLAEEVGSPESVIDWRARLAA